MSPEGGGVWLPCRGNFAKKGINRFAVPDGFN